METTGGRLVGFVARVAAYALIAAGAAVAQRTSYADLDGAWLLADDPFRGWQFAGGVLTPPPGPGLGVEPEAGLFES